MSKSGQEVRDVPTGGYAPPPYGYQPQAYGQPYSGAGYPQQGPPQQYPQQQHYPPPYYQQQPYTAPPSNQPNPHSLGIEVNQDRSVRSQHAGGGGGYAGDEWHVPDEKRLTEDIDIAIRMGFIRKVYGILTMQLVLTFGLACWFNLHTAAGDFLYRNPWLLIIAALGACFTICGLTCIPSVARTAPTNYIMLSVLALAMGIVIGYSTAAVDTPAFTIAVGATAAVTLAVSLFACQTKWDFTGLGVYAFVALIMLMIFGLVCAIVRSRITHIVYASLGALLFSFYLIMDTQKIVGGKHRKYEFSIDDYCFAALALYLDIINLFMYILTIVSASNN